MSLNSTASAERIHIGFFGVRNAGKSSVVNAVTSQNLSIVSNMPGTTTDPVRKAMELLPAGPVVIIDTPGLDDEGALGELRVIKTKEELRRCDVAILVIDATRGFLQADTELLDLFKKEQTPFIVAYNKSDLIDEDQKIALPHFENQVFVSALAHDGIHELKELIAKVASASQKEKCLLSDVVGKGDLVVLVIPIDSSAPKLRIIMPQQMVIRECLDVHAIPVCCQVGELDETIKGLKAKPRLVVTDSQAFKEVFQIVPEDIDLTSFSILMARYKGEFDAFIEGTTALSTLKTGDKVLICESCSHHRQCEDIGTVKMPRWIEQYSQSELEFSFCSGREFPSDLSEYKLIVHCGGCMSNDKEIHHRVSLAKQQSVPIVNYGIAIAQMNGILARSLKVFSE
ncbi:MAG: [FeFe] hydrogenase H-cluster maturation GTPase HydF [Anaerotardibacter sp.]